MSESVKVYVDEERINTFIKEHRALLKDPDVGTSTLQRIVTDTSREFVALSPEVIEAANRAAAAADELADTTLKPGLPASAVFLKEKEYNARLREHKRMDALSQRLQAFFEEANAAYQAQPTGGVAKQIRDEDYADRETSGTGNTVAFTERPKRRGFFSRIFG